MAAMTSLRYFFGIVFFSRVFDIEECTIIDSSLNFSLRVSENHLCEFPKGLEFVRPDIGEILLLKTIDVDGSIIPLEKDDRSRTTGLPFPGACNALLDYPSSKIGINDPVICESGGLP